MTMKVKYEYNGKKGGIDGDPNSTFADVAIDLSAIIEEDPTRLRFLSQEGRLGMNEYIRSYELDQDFYIEIELEQTGGGFMKRDVFKLDSAKAYLKRWHKYKTKAEEEKFLFSYYYGQSCHTFKKEADPVIVSIVKSSELMVSGIKA